MRGLGIVALVRRRLKAYIRKNVASSGQEHSHADVVRQANDVRPGRPSKDTKIVPDTIQQQQNTVTERVDTDCEYPYSQYYVNSRVMTSTGSSRLELWPYGRGSKIGTVGSYQV